MADAVQVIGQKGPLPITTTFQVENDGPTLILLTASAWTQIEKREHRSRFPGRRGGGRLGRAFLGYKATWSG